MTLDQLKALDSISKDLLINAPDDKAEGRIDTSELDEYAEELAEIESQLSDLN